MPIKKIEKSGFYKLSDFPEVSKIQIEKNLEVIIFDEGKINKEIIVGEKSNLKLCGFLEKESDYEVLVRQTGKSSEVKIKYLLLSKNNEKTKAKIHSKIESDNSKSEVLINSLAGENGEIDLDGVIELTADFREMSGHLVEENIFLGDKGKIRGIPTLLVKSNEVEASHACKIEKISQEDLFYLRSRGFDKKLATYVLIESKVRNIFDFLKNESFSDNYLENIMKKIFSL